MKCQPHPRWMLQIYKEKKENKQTKKTPKGRKCYFRSGWGVRQAISIIKE